LPVKVNLQTGSGLEAAARVARYEAFAQSGFKSIFLAHHAGDQAETLLFNLLRGSGVSGMTGMQSERVINGLRILRPLLNVSRQEIEIFARDAQLSWITDESNEDRRFSRNFIRHEVLTAVKQHFPSAEHALVQAAAHFSEAESLLAELAEADWVQVSELEGANMRGLRQLSFTRLKNLLRYRLRCLAWRMPEASRLDEFARQLLHAAPDRHPQLDLPDGCMCVRGGALHWIVRK
jgi:tRNA(Ile)-lysidine synthase